MKKAFVFSLTTMFLMASLLIVSASIKLERSGNNAVFAYNIPSRVDRDLYDTLSMDILNIMGTSTNSSGNITINEIMPRNINQRLGNYLAFLSNITAHKFTQNITFTSLVNALYFNNSSVTYGPGKEWFNLSSAHQINYYSIKINTSESTANISAYWPWTSSGVFVNLTVSDIYSINGYIDPAVPHSINISFPSGFLNLSLQDSLIINTTVPINTSTTIGLKGKIFTGYVLKINDSLTGFSKEFNTTA